MIKIMEQLLEATNELPDIKYKDPIDEYHYNDLYNKSVIHINELVKNSVFDIKENLIQIREFQNSDKLINGRDDECQKFILYSLTVNPNIGICDTTKLTNLVNNLKKDEGTPDAIDVCKNIELLNVDFDNVTNYSKSLLGIPVETNLTTCVAKDLVAKISNNISAISDNIETIGNVMIGQLSECNTEYLFNVTEKIATILISIEKAKVYAYMRAFLQIFQSYNMMNTLTEAVDTSEENVSNYVEELREMIPKCREFFDKFKYKELLTPRKKTINKMNEYMKGALERKYTLKIPIYKVTNASPEAKEIIENKFIKGLDRIVDKYPNYVLLTPDFKDDDDMFIYITLKEPFGDKGDRSDRVQQSKDDGAVIAESVAGVAGAAAIGMGTTVLISSLITKHKERKQEKADRKEFENQSKKLTNVSDFKYVYIKDFNKIFSDAEFVKIKEGTIEAANKIKSLNIDLNNEISRLTKLVDPDNPEDSSAKFINKFNNGIVKKYLEETKKIEDQLSKTNKWIDVESSKKSEIGKLLETLYDQYDYIFYGMQNICSGTNEQIAYGPWKVICSSVKIQLKGKVMTEAANWEDPEYKRINDEIDAKTKVIDSTSVAIDKFIAKNGKESPKLQERYNQLCDERMKLIEERHHIAKNMNESVVYETPLSADERKELPEDVFGLPGRRYPLNDLTHIRLAISRMDPCNSSEKSELARNIAKQICKQKLVGQITVSQSNTNSKYFPEWMYGDASLDGGYIHYGEKKFKVKDILNEGSAGSTLEFYI